MTGCPTWLAWFLLIIGCVLGASGFLELLQGRVGWGLIDITAGAAGVWFGLECLDPEEEW